MNSDSGDEKKHISLQRDIEIFIGVAVFTFAAILLFEFIPFEWSFQITLLAEMVVFLIVALPALVGYKLQGKNIKDLFSFKLSEIKYIILMLIVKFIMTILLNALDISPIGISIVYNKLTPFMLLIYHVFFVGLCEEFIFRFYVQETLEVWFGKYKIIAPFVSAAIFGAYHLINGTVLSGILAFVMGLLWGYLRYFKKDCGLITLAIIHGLSNYLLYIMSVVNGMINGVNLI